jgi:hypothetical protein
MCGIVGAIGKSINKEIVENLFVGIEKRGSDAAGFWTPVLGTVKAAVKVSNLVVATKDKFEQSVAETNVFIGHTRWATHGNKKDNNNNHPLESENWVLVHNGIISSAKDVIGYPYKGGTDSENILAYVETFGLKEGLSKIGSSAAIILAPKNEGNTLYLWKTYSSDMAICYIKEEKTLYIVSSKMYFEPIFKSLVRERKVLGGLITEKSLKKDILVTEPKPRELWKMTYEDEKLSGESVATLPSPPSNYGHWQGGRYIEPEPDKDSDKLKSNEARVFPANRTTVTTITKGNPFPEGVCSGHKEEWDEDPDLIFVYDIVRLTRMPTTDEWRAELTYTLNGEETVGRTNEEYITPGESFTVEDLFRVEDFLDIDEECYAVVQDEITQEIIFPIGLLEKASPPPCYGIFYSRKSECNVCMFIDKCDIAQETEKHGLGVCIGKYNYELEQCKKCEAVAFCIGNSVCATP